MAKKEASKSQAKTNPQEKPADIPSKASSGVEKTKKSEKPGARKSKKSDKDEYKSDVLSKKDQRKLKKMLKSQGNEEDEDEDEEFADAKDLLDDQAEEDSEEEEEEEEGEEELDLNKLAESESESDIEEGEEEEEEDDDEDDDEEEDEEDEEDEDEEAQEDVPLSDVEYDSDADVVPHTKLTINNIAALKDSLARIQLPWSKHSFIEHQSITSSDNTEAGIKDVYDDTERELAFYKQGLDAVKQGRTNLVQLKVPFSRPMDYFAEMVKSDEHMDKLRNKLLTEAANKKASEDAKKQRQLKKFGKQVQHETLQSRQKEKRETLERIKSLKKKKGNNEFNNDDEFQIALEEATRDEKKDNKRHKPNGKRLAKDAKYGFGGKKRGSRKNDASSSADVFGVAAPKRKAAKSQRPGKSKRSRRK